MSLINKNKNSQQQPAFSYRVRSALGLGLIVLMVLSSYLVLPVQKAHAASLTWDGGGADNNWSTCANWTTDTCPVAGDTVTFNGTSTKSATIDAGAPASVATLTIAAGYTGTITLARTFATTTTFSQATGTFTASNQAFTMAAFTLSGGTFTASSGTTTVSGAVTVTGTPTFNHNSGTINFTGGTATIACNGISLNLATFNNTGAKTISSGCSVPVGSSPTIANAVTLNGTMTGTGTLTTTTGTFLIGTTGTLSGFSGLSTGSNLTINGSLNAGTFSPFSVNGLFSLGAASTFTAPAGTLSAGSLSFSAGTTFNANGGTVDYTGNSSSSACGGVTFNLVTFHNTATKTIGSDCTFPLGNNPTIANAVTLNGTMSGTGTLSTTAGTFTLGTTGVLSGFSGISTGAALTINGTLNAGSYATFTSGGAFTLGAASVFTAPSGSMNLQGSVTFNAGMTFNANGGTVNLVGSTGTISCANATFNLVTINAGTTIKTINSDCNLPLGNNPTITRTVLNGTLSGTGTLTHTASTFQLNAGATLSGFSGLQDNTSLIIAGATLDANAFSTFNISSALTVSSGSFTATTSGFSIGTTLTMSGGTFNAPSGTLNVSGLNITGGTFNANGGLVNINDGTGTLTCGGATFNLVTFTNYGPKTINSGCTLPVGNNATFANTGLLTFNGGILTGTGDLTVGGDVAMLSGSPLSGFDSLTLANSHDLVIGSSNVDLGTLSALTVGDFDQGNTYGGAFTFTAPAGTMYVSGNFVAGAAGTHFSANGGTLVFNGNGAQSLSCSNTVFNDVVLSNTGGFVQVSSDCNLPLGNSPTATASNLYLLGTLSGSGTLTTNGTLWIAGTGYVGLDSLEGFTGLSANNLTIDATTISFNTFSSLDINGGFTLLNNAIFTSIGTNMTLSGDLLIDPGSTFNANGGTLTFDGANEQLATCSYANFNEVAFNKSAGYFSVGVDCDLPLGSNPVVVMGNDPLYVYGTLSGTGTINDTVGTLDLVSSSALSGFSGLNANNLYIDGFAVDLGVYNTLDVNGNFLVTNSGAFTTTSANMTVGGNFQIDPGSTFNANGGTVILDGSNQVIQGTTFNNLTKIVASADTLTFPAGGTETILGNLVLKGGSSTQLLSLVSSTPGIQWAIDAQGSRTLQYLSVTDSNNVNATTMAAYDSIDGGNNTNWQFMDTPVPPGPTPSPDASTTVLTSQTPNSVLSLEDLNDMEQSRNESTSSSASIEVLKDQPKPTTPVIMFYLIGLISLAGVIGVVFYFFSIKP